MHSYCVECGERISFGAHPFRNEIRCQKHANFQLGPQAAAQAAAQAAQGRALADAVQSRLKDVAENKMQVLEDFTSAYLAETQLKPSEVELVQYEELDGHKIKYVSYFRKRLKDPPRKE